VYNWLGPMYQKVINNDVIRNEMAWGIFKDPDALQYPVKDKVSAEIWGGGGWRVECRGRGGVLWTCARASLMAAGSCPLGQHAPLL
jgi:hypothetical protein